VGKYIGFWQAVVQTRIWIPIKNAATVYPHTYVIMVPHFCLSASNSTAYWLHCINSYIITTTVFYTTLQQRDRLPVGQHLWRQGWCNWWYCIGVILQLIERTKSLQCDTSPQQKLELTDTVAI